MQNEPHTFWGCIVTKLAVLNTSAQCGPGASMTTSRAAINLSAAQRKGTVKGSRAKHATAVHSDRDAYTPQRPYILLAEDDDVTAIVATQMLQQVGLHPRRCVDGNEVFDLACFSTSTPDLILMDLNMPEMDGLAAARLIREFYQARGLPCPTIIGFTSMTDLNTRSQMRSAGVIDFLAKPPTLQDIRTVVLARLPGGECPASSALPPLG